MLIVSFLFMLLYAVSIMYLIVFCDLPKVDIFIVSNSLLLLITLFEGLSSNFLSNQINFEPRKNQCIPSSGVKDQDVLFSSVFLLYSS